MENQFLVDLRTGKPLSFKQQIMMIVQLSIPAILAQISSVVMEYIDAAMVGRMGANASASIGLVASTTWLLGSVCHAAGIGFTVQIAQLIGAGKEKEARNLVKQGLLVTLAISMGIACLGVIASMYMPGWLGGAKEICQDATKYLLVFSLAIPIHQMNSVAGGMLQCSGNMKFPSMMHILMCFLDVFYNLLLIFPSRTVVVLGKTIFLPGAGLQVLGAALGTALAELTIMVVMLYVLLRKSVLLSLRKGETLQFQKPQLLRAWKIAAPVGVEQIIICFAYVMSTKIVAPLGSISIAAHSFSVTAESFCYMPGYGLASAGTTIIGQSIGAKRKDLTRRLGWLITLMTILIMTVTGCMMYGLAHWMIGFLTPEPAIRALGTKVLRIEAFAEPLYGASIVVSGILRGAGDTLIPSCINFFSMWCVRIPLSALLAGTMGLEGVWLAMCIELCVRGTLFLVRLKGKKWSNVEAV